MKNKSISLLLISFCFAFAGYGQNLQATIVPGGSPNSIYIKVKSKTVATNSAVPISTINFCIQLRDTLPLPKPTLTVTEILPLTGVGTYNINDVSAETPGYYTWNIDGTDGTTNTVWAADEEITFIEVFFSGGPGTVTYSRLVHLPDGGITGASTFYLSIGGVPQQIENELFYGPTAINNTAGVYPSGNGVVTLPGLVLPVKFSGFSVSKKENDAVLNWQVESESSITDRYEVERSVNGVLFQKIATVAPKNNGSSTNSYDMTDNNISSVNSNGILYYKIKQVDKDGKMIYSPIKNLRLNAKPLTVGVYPNPVKGSANLSIDLEKDADATITITDASGKQLQNISTTLFKGANIKKINTASLASGSYLLKIQTATETKTISIVKSN